MLRKGHGHMPPPPVNLMVSIFWLEQIRAANYKRARKIPTRARQLPLVPYELPRGSALHWAVRIFTQSQLVMGLCILETVLYEKMQGIFFFTFL